MALTLPSESTESWATRGKKGLVIFTDSQAALKALRLIRELVTDYSLMSWNPPELCRNAFRTELAYEVYRIRCRASRHRDGAHVTLGEHGIVGHTGEKRACHEHVDLQGQRSLPLRPFLRFRSHRCIVLRVFCLNPELHGIEMALTLPSESTESWATRGKKGLVIFTDSQDRLLLDELEST
jgi:hypothetical protein